MTASKVVTTDADAIAGFVAAALGEVGLADPGCREVADHLSTANLLGHDSHGVQQVPGYLRSITMGRIRCDAKPSSLASARRAVARIDADGAPGQWAGRLGMEAAISRASDFGVGVCGVTNSNHFGMAGQFCRTATEVGLIAYATSDTNVVDLAPFGSMVPTVGNDPVSWGIPRPNGGPPVILDMACGAVSGGKIKHYDYSGRAIPALWGMNSEGQPTTDPKSVLVNSSGGYKGSGLALISDLLCGPLLGTTAAMFKHKPTIDAANGTGHLFVAIDPEAFGSTEDFAKRVDDVVEAFRSAEPVDPEQPVMYPGELEAITAAKRRADGIPLPRMMVDTLLEVTDRNMVASFFPGY